MQKTPQWYPAFSFRKMSPRGAAVILGLPAILGLVAGHIAGRHPIIAVAVAVVTALPSILLQGVSRAKSRAKAAEWVERRSAHQRAEISRLGLDQRLVVEMHAVTILPLAAAGVGFFIGLFI